MVNNVTRAEETLLVDNLGLKFFWIGATTVLRDERVTVQIPALRSLCRGVDCSPEQYSASRGSAHLFERSPRIFLFLQMVRKPGFAPGPSLSQREVLLLHHNPDKNGAPGRTCTDEYGFTKPAL